MTSPFPIPSTSGDDGDRTITSVDSATERWRLALQQTQQPSIEEFLPPTNAPGRRQLLVKLISIELAERIARNEVCRVEQFLGEESELESSDILTLILAELQARQTRGESVKRREYSQRFPDHYEALKQRTSSNGSTVTRASQRRPQALRAGQRIGDYEILSRLGAGSHADVYLARQLSLGRDVALKVSLGKKSEGRALGKLDHPHIVQVYSEHVVAGHQLLVMRYVPGRTLDEWLQHRQTKGSGADRGRDLLEWLRADGEPRDRVQDDRADQIRNQRLTSVSVHLCFDLAKALAHAHERGVLHLDIKPSNVLIDMDGRGLLMDFNVAALPDENGLQAAKPTGGTLAYMPPEQLSYFARETTQLSQRIDTRTDLYSLGVVFYELLAGVSPWPVPDENSDENAARQLFAQRMNKPPRLTDVAKGISPGLASIVDRLLSPNGEDRYPSAAALVSDLKHWFAREPLGIASDSGWLERTQNWFWRNRKVLVSAAAALIIGMAFFKLGSTTRRFAQNADSKVAGPITQPVDHSLDDHEQVGQGESTPPKLQTKTDIPSVRADESPRDVDHDYNIPSVVDVVRSSKRAPLNMQLRRAFSSGEDWQVAINPLSLYGTDLPDNWERQYARVMRDQEKRRVLCETVTEVLLVQLVAHPDKADDEFQLRFWRRLPSDYRSLPLMLALERQLKEVPISEVSTASLLAAAESEFERYLLGVVAAIRAEYETSLTLFTKSKRENPDRYTADYYYGLCAERAGKPQMAIEAYLACEQDRPHFVPPYLSLGLLYAREGKLKHAEEQFRTAARYAPRNPEVLLSLANILIRLEKPAVAIRMLDRVLESGKRTAGVLTRRATAKIANHDQAGAIRDLNEALKLDPRFRPAQQKLQSLQ